MKKLPSPWSVRGVSLEARAKAARAAARRRMTIGAWVTGAMTSAANAELGVGGSATADETPRGGDGAPAGDRADDERRNEQRFDELAAAITALSEQLDKAAGPTARLVNVDQLALAIKPFKQALERAEKSAGDDTDAGRVTGRISNLPGARGG